MRRKDVVAVGICAIMALSGLAACGSTGKANAQDEMGNPEVGGVQIPNPFVDCETLEEAEELTGFGFVVPDTWGECDTRSVRAIQKEMVEVIYKKGADSEEELRIRKALGSEDISGDYNVYAEEKTVEAGESSITIKGDGEQFMLAVWTKDGYTYSVSTTGLSEEAMADLAGQIQ